MKNYKHLITYVRLQSHLMQIYLTMKLKAEDVLEVGKGYEFVSAVLDLYCNLTTIDIRERFNPDLLMDISNLEHLDTLKNDAYDLILICEVLEHISYEKIEGILKILKNKTKKYLIISVPNQNIYFNVDFSGFRMGRLGRLLEKFFYLFSIRMDNVISKLDYKIRGKRKKFGNEVGFGINPSPTPHLWELGRDKYSVKLFRQLLEKHFVIINEERIRKNPHHHFFVLKK